MQRRERERVAARDRGSLPSARQRPSRMLQRHGEPHQGGATAQPKLAQAQLLGPALPGPPTQLPMVKGKAKTQTLAVPGAVASLQVQTKAVSFASPVGRRRPGSAAGRIGMAARTAAVATSVGPGGSITAPMLARTYAPGPAFAGFGAFDPFTPSPARGDAAHSLLLFSQHTGTASPKGSARPSGQAPFMSPPGPSLFRDSHASRRQRRPPQPSPPRSGSSSAPFPSPPSAIRVGKKRPRAGSLGSAPIASTAVASTAHAEDNNDNRWVAIVRKGRPWPLLLACVNSSLLSTQSALSVFLGSSLFPLQL